jgi:hypothetical protein
MSSKNPVEGGPYPFVRGMTVKELKALIKDWPEVNHEGEPTEVWIETGRCLTSPVVVAMALNYRVMDDGTKTADLVLESNAFENKFE